MKTSTIGRRWLTPALLVVAAGCFTSFSTGCAHTGATASSPAEPMAGAADDESTQDLHAHHRHHHHGGFAMFIAMSLDSLNTTPEQAAAIEKIQDDLHAKMMPAHEAEKAVLTSLADQIAAGSIDAAKVDAGIAQVATAAGGVHDAVADSLNELHKTLTPEQRKALVQKVEAHFEVWHKTNTHEETAEAEKTAHGHLAHLTKELNLTPDQVEKIRADFKAKMATHPHFDRAEAEAHMKAFGAAFESDTFDAKTQHTGGPANAHIAEFGLKRMAHFYEAVTPVLTPDQRAKLADSLRKHANYKRTPTAT